MSRVKRVSSAKELDRAVDDFITRGYRLQERGEYSAKVKEKDYGEPFITGLLAFFSLLFSALLLPELGLPAGTPWGVMLVVVIGYISYSWYTAKTVLIKVTDDDDATEPSV